MTTLYLVPEEIASKNPGIETESIHTNRDFFLLKEWLGEEETVIASIRSDLLEKVPLLKELIPEVEFVVIDSFDNIEIPIPSAVKAVAKQETFENFENQLHKGRKDEEQPEAGEISVPNDQDSGSEI